MMLVTVSMHGKHNEGGRGRGRGGCSVSVLYSWGKNVSVWGIGSTFYTPIMGVGMYVCARSRAHVCVCNVTKL